MKNIDKNILNWKQIQELSRKVLQSKNIFEKFELGVKKSIRILTKSRIFFILPCVLALIRFSFYFDTTINILISALRLSPQVL